MALPLQIVSFHCVLFKFNDANGLNVMEECDKGLFLLNAPHLCSLFRSLSFLVP